MPNYQELLNLDQVFQSSKDQIIINDLRNLTVEDRKQFTDMIRETFTSDMVSVMPRCSCGELRGEYLVGQTCDLCQTPVKQIIEEDIAPKVWFRKPANIRKLVNPIIWIMLTQRFSKNRFSLIQWLTDRNYGSNTGVKLPKIVHKLVADNIPRGYNAFIDNFDEILTYLFALPDYQYPKNRRIIRYLVDSFPEFSGMGPNADPLRALLARHRDCVFCDYIPLPNKSLLVLERSALGDYGEAVMFDMVNILNTMVSIDQDFHDHNRITIENRTARILGMLANYYQEYFKSNLSPKEGLIRRNVYGGRGNHGFRAVITSHEDIHNHDEIYIPWCVGVTVFRQHLLNRLMNRNLPYGGLTHNEAVGLLMSHVNKFHPVLDQIFKEMIATSPSGRGIACMNQRN